jgi:hypothetical protein
MLDYKIENIHIDWWYVLCLLLPLFILIVSQYAKRRPRKNERRRNTMR